jgi:hypothetical protein
MNRQLLNTIVLTGFFLLMAVGAGLAAGQPAMPSGNPSPLMAPPQAPAASMSPQAVTPSPSPQALPGAKAAVRAAAADDIRDIRGPLHIPDPLVWLYYAIGACLALAAAAGAWRWFKRHKALRAKRAYEIAFEKLERAKTLMEPELADAFSVAVSDAVRTYIEQRFEVRVTRHTTEEFMARIQAEPAGGLGEYRDLLQDFLSHCDLAKFARFLLTVDQMKEMHESAWQFVDKTRPQPEETTSQQASEVPDTAPEAAAVRETARRRSFVGLLRAIGQKLISRKTAAGMELGAGSAVAAGGR